MENNVVTLDTAKKLKAAGFPQNTAYGFYYRVARYGDPGIFVLSDMWRFDDKETAAAPTAQAGFGKMRVMRSSLVQLFERRIVMSKVKLIVCEGYGNQGLPRVDGTAKVIDLKLEVPDTHDIMGVIRTEFDEEADGSRRDSDAVDPVIRYERINDLVGKLLTITDAAARDSEQRKALKDLVTQSCWGWYSGQQAELTTPWRKDKGISVQ
jgi:hypothetical protein